MVRAPRPYYCFRLEATIKRKGSSRWKETVKRVNLRRYQRVASRASNRDA